jgi:MYXO-CTERM domain-containing protein
VNGGGKGATDGSPISGGCGCATTATPTGLIYLVGLALLVLRKRSRLLPILAILIVWPTAARADAQSCQQQGGRWLTSGVQPICACPDGLAQTSGGSCTVGPDVFRGIYVLRPQFPNQVIERIDLDGRARVVGMQPSTFPFLGLGVDPTHHFLLTLDVYHNGQVFKVDTHGSFTPWFSDPRLGLPSTAGAIDITTLSTASAWYVLITRIGSGGTMLGTQLLRISSDGTVTTVLDSNSGAPLSTYGSYLAAAPDGSFYFQGGGPYVTDYFVNRLRPDGVTERLATTGFHEGAVWRGDGLLLFQVTGQTLGFPATGVQLLSPTGQLTSFPIQGRVSVPSQDGVLSVSGDMLFISAGAPGRKDFPPPGVFRLQRDGTVKPVAIYSPDLTHLQTVLVVE